MTAHWQQSWKVVLLPLISLSSYASIAHLVWFISWLNSLYLTTFSLFNWVNWSHERVQGMHRLRMGHAAVGRTYFGGSFLWWVLLLEVQPHGPLYPLSCTTPWHLENSTWIWRKCWGTVEEWGVKWKTKIDWKTLSYNWKELQLERKNPNLTKYSFLLQLLRKYL